MEGVTGRADVQVKDGRCQLEIMIMVVTKNARKHITSISCFTIPEIRRYHPSSEKDEG